MRVLFLHPRFPGPFRSLAACLGAMSENRVLFIAERHRRELAIPGVRRLLVASPEPVSDVNSAEREILFAVRRGANLANAMLKLQREGFSPDVVCYSAGSGSGFYAADVFPAAFKLVYADWFQTKGESYTFFNSGQPRSPEEFAPWRLRNMCQYNALTEAHLSITPTQWQKSQYPEELRAHMHVLSQGVDADFFTPDARSGFSLPDCDPQPAEIVSFTGRDLAPHKGFPQFARSLPRLLTARPHCHAVIMAAGRSMDNSPATMPSELQFSDQTLQKRVHWLGFRPYDEYRRLLQASTLHIHLSAPYALSSGLLEAMGCGCLVLGSDTQPVTEVIRHGENGMLCSFHDSDGMADTAAALLERAAKKEKALHVMRKAARNTVATQYNSRSLGLQHLQLLLSAMEEQRQRK